MTIHRTPKRSRNVALTTLTAVTAGAALTACDGDAADAEGQVFATVAECTAAGTFSADECRDAYAQAQADDLNNAPRFEDRVTCEGEFGAGECQARSDGTGSFWTPLLAGFIIGNVAGEVIDEVGDAARRRRYAGLYKNRRSDTWYTGGSAYAPLSRRGSGYGVSSAAFTRPVSAPRVHSRSSVVSRGGFGGRSGSGG